MLQMLDDYLHVKKNLKTCWISSKYIDDQRILQRYNWPQSTKSGSLVLPLLDAYLHAKNQKDQLIPSTDIDDQYCNLMAEMILGHK